MKMRDQSILDNRPEILSARVSMNMCAEEQFQNKTLRPVIKFQNELLTEADMMRIFRVDRVTLYRWRQKQILPWVKLSRNVYYIKQIICMVLLAKSGFLEEP